MKAGTTLRQPCPAPAGQLGPALLYLAHARSTVVWCPFCARVRTTGSGAFRSRPGTTCLSFQDRCEFSNAGAGRLQGKYREGSSDGWGVACRFVLGVARSSSGLC